MKISVIPKHKRSKEASFLILISLLLLVIFYVIDELFLNGHPIGFILVILNIMVVLSWILAFIGTILGIQSIYQTKHVSFILLILLFLGFTFSMFGLLEIFI